MKGKYVIGSIAAVMVLAYMTRDSLISSLQKFIPSVEGFRSTPYWDVKRWSWGYGTPAPGQFGTITRADAFTEMFSHLYDDYDTLKTKVTRSLSVRQWTALLSFSYNEGIGSALKLVPLINSGDDDSLSDKWHQYVYADGVVNSDLVERRQKEWALWVS